MNDFKALINPTFRIPAAGQFAHRNDAIKPHRMSYFVRLRRSMVVRPTQRKKKRNQKLEGKKSIRSASGRAGQRRSNKRRMETSAALAQIKACMASPSNPVPCVLLRANGTCEEIVSDHRKLGQVSYALFTVCPEQLSSSLVPFILSDCLPSDCRLEYLTSCWADLQLS